MPSNYKKLGQFIRPVNRRDTDESVTLLLGVSIQKKFIPSIANTIGTDMSTYKIIQRNQFAYGPVTSRNGDRISIALLEDYAEAIVSQAYTCFTVLDENELLPQYLMMWFRRPEFDRYARFMSHGSAREIFSWDELCNTELPVPAIAKQREIVAEYHTIQNRITLNNQLILTLETTAQAVYKQWFVEFEFPNEAGQPYKSSGGELVESELGEIPKGWEVGKLSSIMSYSTKKTPIKKLRLDNYLSTENMLQNKGGITVAASLPAASSVTKFEVGDILISNIRPYFKKIWLAGFEGGCSNDVLCLTPKSHIPPLFCYQTLEKDSFFEYVMAGSKGTKMPRGDKKWIMNYHTVVPEGMMLERFYQTVTPLSSLIIHKKRDNNSLLTMSNLLLSKLATIDSPAPATAANQPAQLTLAFA
jgi:type I restriction enzyme S subunit